MRLSLSTKRATFAPAVLVQTVQWSSADFQLATSGGLVSAISLEFQVTNATDNVAYIGVRCQTTEGLLNVADRLTIGAVKDGKTITFTPRSVPALADIKGNITTIYVDVTILTNSGGYVDIQGVLTDHDGVVASSDFIGLDAWAKEGYRIQYISMNLLPALPGSVNNVLYVVPPDFRATLMSAIIELWPTPSYAGDLQASFVFDGINIATAASARDRLVCVSLYPQITLVSGQQLEGYVINSNPANSYIAKLSAHIREYY